MENQVGGYHKMPFTMKDLYNRMSAVSTVDFAASHAGRALGYLEHKADMDPNFFGTFSYDNSNQLLNLFWGDGKARLDYETYGHSVAFDSTYKTNSYGKPLLIWIGVNNHFKTCPFGYAILHNESTSCYMWAIKAFLECMNGVAPKTVVTDGDLAMEASIEALMPNAVHRLCYWHLHNKAILKGKDCTFAERLSDLCFTYYEEEVFDHKLNELITDHELDGTDYAAKLWATKHKWGETFLRGHFFCGMTTTQRNEGINAVLKRKVNENMRLYDFVRTIDMATSWVRHGHLKEDYQCLHTNPVLGVTNLPKIEAELSKIYTRNMFYKVRQQMSREGDYRVSSLENDEEGTIMELQKYGDNRYRRFVYATAGRDFFVCECQHFISFGIPCRHIFAAIKRLNVIEMPKSLILTQWTLEAGLSTTQPEPANYPDKESEVTRRFGELSSILNEVAYLGSQSQAAYREATLQIQRICVGLKESLHIGGDIGKSKLPLRRHSEFKVANPDFTKTKGTGRMAGSRAGVGWKCSVCKKSGHNKLTCPSKVKKTEKAGDHEDSAYDDEQSQLEGEEDVNWTAETTMDMERNERGGTPELQIDGNEEVNVEMEEHEESENMRKFNLWGIQGGCVSWKANLQKVVALSSTEAEYMAAIEAIKEAIWLKGLTKELGFNSQNITVHCDNQSALHLMKNPMFHERSKHIDIKLHFIREVLANREVQVKKINTTNNLADMFTKGVTQDKFRHCLNLLNIGEYG
ncbi:protein FAR1-RELATED SEQUENCE 11-like [Humulus lupulus]|uniref:protein FAR1-RELATED SEQUENCE 11-like n=1 Tax=Humulus lupulus TaxID=3486 RepID=UPI002B408131|nr:protein FAR1-RELATED SEQUENCE 11-like [Humulus lupulus]